ncbi:acyl carrier protein [Streptomyces sp. NPDC048172]|uniref:acyl carrier protein n=1 Tax=Streptomyces sp. NPDC048172 TaxID=3365505 RepID=UPI0037212DB9
MTERRVHEVVAGIAGLRGEELDASQRLYEDLGFDSVMLLELKNRLEDDFPTLREISLPEMLPSMGNVASLVAYVDVVTAEPDGAEWPDGPDAGDGQGSA